jgi:thiamine-phosphate pyrophosphorylase
VSEAARFPGGVYLITDSALCGARGVVVVVDTVIQAVEGGVRAVQVRDKSASDAEFYDLVLRVAAAVGQRVPVIVNDRVDVFLAARAAGAAVRGVHVGQSDTPVAAVRRAIGTGGIIGLSASTFRQLAAVDALPPATVDYLGIGAIRPTMTKSDHPEPIGVGRFAELCAATSTPCVAIGGIRSADLPSLRAGGASGVAVVSAIYGTDDPRRSAQRLAEAWCS